MKQIVTVVCFTCIGIQVATSQCPGQRNIIYNRQVPEKIVEPSVIYPQQFAPIYQPMREAQSLPTSQIRDIQPLLTSQRAINPTTIISDCTPNVCKTLIDIIQLMSVANLIKEKKGGPDVALQLAAPFLKELMLTQPNLFLTKPINPIGNTCPCSNPVLTNPISPNLLNPSVISTCPNQVSPNLISPTASLYSNFVGSPNGISSVNMNGVVGNILSMLGN